MSVGEECGVHASCAGGGSVVGDGLGAGGCISVVIGGGFTGDEGVVFILVVGRYPAVGGEGAYAVVEVRRGGELVKDVEVSCI